MRECCTYEKWFMNHTHIAPTWNRKVKWYLLWNHFADVFSMKHNLTEYKLTLSHIIFDILEDWIKYSYNLIQTRGMSSPSTGRSRPSNKVMYNSYNHSAEYSLCPFSPFSEFVTSYPGNHWYYHNVMDWQAIHISLKIVFCPSPKVSYSATCQIPGVIIP